MYYVISNLMTGEEVAAAAKILAEADFIDGREAERLGLSPCLQVIIAREIAFDQPHVPIALALQPQAHGRQMHEVDENHRIEAPGQLLNRHVPEQSGAEHDSGPLLREA